jgi:hypothetical protein
MNTDHTLEITRQLVELKAIAPDLRFGQMMSVLGLLAEDMFDRDLRTVNDDQLLEVIDRFQSDLARRAPQVACLATS